MSAVWTRRIVDALIALIVIVLIARIGVAGINIVEGDVQSVSYAASSDTTTIESLDASETAFWQVKEGTIRVDNQTGLWFFRLAVQLALVGFFLAVLWYLRGLLTRISAGEVFTDANITALKRIGQILLLGCAIGLVSTIISQLVILGAIPPLDGKMIHPSISWNVKGVENIWLEYSPPIEALILSLLAFSTAGAFQAGKEYREDSESVV